MTSVQKNISVENFCKEYASLTETKKNTFSRLCNKLLNDNFIYISKPEDKNDYYEILTMKPIIEFYFRLIDFDLIHIDTYKIFYIQTLADRNRLRLKKIDTVILLVLRLLYQKGSLDVNLSSDISTTLDKIITEVNRTGIFKNQLTKTDYVNSLRLLKKYKMIDYDWNDFEDDNVVVIYPTILYVIKLDNVDMLQEKLKTYIATKEENENETEED